MSFKRLLRVGLVLALSTGASAWAANGDVVTQVKARGTLRCGVSEGIAGFSAKDAAGQWRGLDADFCRAVAAAVLGDPARVRFVSLRAAERLPTLQAGQIDLLSRNTTWSLFREAGLKLQFPGVLFYDGQAVMVPREDRAPGGSAGQGLARLAGATVCVKRGTNHGANLGAYFAARGLKVQTLAVDASEDLSAALVAGRCRAISSDASQLSALRLGAPGGVAAYTILPEQISKQPQSPVVLQGDEDWVSLVRWVLFVLIAAEEYGVTRDNVAARLADPEVQRQFGIAAEYGKGLGVDAGWVQRIVQSVGNYGEMFERNVGHQSPLQLDRGLNRQWTEGGLMYAPPMH